MNEKSGGRRHWDSYLDAPLFEDKLLQPGCNSAFDSQREHIDKLLRRFKPHRVACLGSGYLNDLPIELLFQISDETYFIDWLPNISLLGLGRRIIQHVEGVTRCIFCECTRPERFCRSFTGSMCESSSVCTAFSGLEDSKTRCVNYEPGNDPRFVRADVTSGRASRFAQRVFNAVQKSDTPKQAFNRAIRECRRCSDVQDPIPIQSDSFNLVTSSLVASQFDAEPYDYFARLVERKFGRDAVEAKERVLVPLMEELRAELFRVQIEGHCAEIFRLLNKEDGRAYLSVELFRSLPACDDFFLTHESPQLLESLERHFFFDFVSIPAEKAVRSHAMGEGTSIVQSFVLRPKSDHYAPAA